MGALINIVCELKITSGSKKNCVKISWWSDSEFKSYKRKTVLRGHEIHSSVQLKVMSVVPEDTPYFDLNRNMFSCSGRKWLIVGLEIQWGEEELYKWAAWRGLLWCIFKSQSIDNNRALKSSIAPRLPIQAKPSYLVPIKYEFLTSNNLMLSTVYLWISDIKYLHSSTSQEYKI